MRKLIIQADDFGYAKEFNRGILEAIKAGIVTSVSVLVNHKFVDSKLLADFKGSISLHLEISPEVGESSKLSQKTISDQWRKFNELFGKNPTHLDRHKASPCLEDAARPFILDLAEKYNLPVRAMGEKDRQFLRAKGIRTTDHFIFSYGPKNLEDILSALRMLPEGITELMVHPGYFDPQSKSSYNLPRKQELSILLNSQFGQVIQEQHIQLINYRDL